MISLVDSHCHLNQLDFSKGDLNQIFLRAKESQVTHFLCVCITLEDVNDILTLAKQYQSVDATIGLHPTELAGTEGVTIDQLIQLANDPNVVGLGETGLDYYRNKGDTEWQRQRFRHHIQAAKEVKKPLIVHSRLAKEDTLAILKEEKAEEVGGVLHCFTEDMDMAIKGIDLNFYISFSGIVTFRNAVEVQNVAKQIPLNRMLIETDSPYLAPDPFRGQSNEPAYVRLVADFIAKLRNISFEEVAQQTTQNYFNLFGKKNYV